jgi:type II secretory pathway component GspD/PulD (secretin)
MKGCSALPIAIIALTAMPLLGVAQDHVQKEQLRFTPFPLKYAVAANCVKKLRAVLAESGDVAIFSDEGTNTVYLRARPEKIQQAKAILHRLDVGVPNYLTIIPLEHTSAARTADTLQVLLRLTAFFADDDCDIRVTADGSGNTIIISASERTVEQAKKILHWLDVMDK